MKRFLICLFSFLFIGCSIAGGAVLLSNSSYSDEYRGGDRQTQKMMQQKMPQQMMTFGRIQEIMQQASQVVMAQKMIHIR